MTVTGLFSFVVMSFGLVVVAVVVMVGKLVAPRIGATASQRKGGNESRHYASVTQFHTTKLLRYPDLTKNSHNCATTL